MFNKKQDATETPATQPAPAAAPELSALAASGQPAKDKATEASKNAAAPPVPTSLMTAEAQAFMNQSTAAAVREAIQAAVQSLGPIIAKIDEARRAPDPKVAEREARERQLFAQDLEDQRLGKERLQNQCPHRYPSGQWSISLVHNFPDRQPRGTCHLCGCWINPREWQIGPPSPGHPRGTPHIVEAHSMYKVVLELEALKS